MLVVRHYLTFVGFTVRKKLKFGNGNICGKGLFHTDLFSKIELLLKRKCQESNEIFHGTAGAVGYKPYCVSEPRGVF